MYHLKIRNEVEKIESQSSEFCNSLSEAIEGILFLGSTGGGKTTLIEFLLGEKLVINIEYGNPYLESSSNNIGSGPNSTTREIMVYKSQDNQLYIDTPGFSDTYGEYTAIKNYFALENILQCKDIKGFKFGFVLAKSVLFYEAIRNKDFIDFVKSIKSFIPSFGSTEWMNQAFIVVTKTEKRTTTNDVIKALSNAIKENNLDSKEQAFFQNIIENRKIALFPLPEEPYESGTPFHNPDANEHIIQLIRQSSYIPLAKQDFKEFNLSLSLNGEVLKDISIAKGEISSQISPLMSAIKDYQQKILTALPSNSFITLHFEKNYEKQKKVLVNYLNNFEKLCTSPEEEFYTLAMRHFNGTKELVTNLCELDYSIKFMKKFTAFDDNLININDIKDKFKDIIRETIVTYNWKLCTLNSYKTFFQSFKKDTHTQQKSIDTLLKNNADARTFVKNLFDNTDKKLVLSQLIDQCQISKQEGQEIKELASSNEKSALNKLATFLTNKEQLQYHRCKITGNEPSIMEIAFDHNYLSECEEIAIYGRYGIKIDQSIETPLRGKNLVMIAPVIEIVGDQKIILSGKEGKAHSVSQANEEKDGLAGNPGESSGSFFGYSHYKQGGLLTLHAEGGKGADGQNGGNGKVGKKGVQDDGYELQSYESDLVYSKKLLHDKLEGMTYNWYKVTRFSDHGKPGTRGGDGKSGGEGGKGGLEGQVDFKVLNPNSLEKCDYVINKGLNGKNGIPGKGGIGGQHGDALQGVWHYPECTPIFFFCGLWRPNGYWEDKPTPQTSNKAAAAMGESGSSFCFNKSNHPIPKDEILSEKHKAEYVKFILDQENNNVYEFYEENTVSTCDFSIDNQYTCF